MNVAVIWVLSGPGAYGLLCKDADLEATLKGVPDYDAVFSVTHREMSQREWDGLPEYAGP